MSAQLPDARANADGFFLKGIVRDSLTLEPMPKASVMALPSARAVITDDRGLFGLAMNVGDTLLRVSSVGYSTIELPVRRNSHNLIVVYLPTSTTQLEELVVKKSKYSKKNNPAVDFVNRLRKSADIGNPERHDYFNYDKYERITLALND
ncbi:MAG: carboxypeptidase-like regulatory domain-containing protein, partial [Muribaculaceae bacterium]|nr:carboxypeptidase-like regulatory domain-containing protein [Muribaculaceae bacterium]